MIVQLTTGKCSVLPFETAVRLWLVKNGERKGTKAEKEKVRRIRKFFFNPDRAPASWKRENSVDRPKPEPVALNLGLGNDSIRMPYKD